MNKSLEPSEPSGQDQAYLKQLSRLGESLDLCIPTSAQECRERIIEEHNRAMRALARMGLYCLLMKNKYGGDELERALAAAEMPTRRAEEAIQFARLLLLANETKGRTTAKRILSLPGPSVKALLSIDPEILERTVNQGEFDLDDVDCMPVDMLRKEVRKMRVKNEDLSGQVHHWREATHQLQHAAGVATAGSEHPASVTRARSELAALAEQAMTIIAAIGHQAEVILRAPDLGAGRDERMRNIEAVVRPMMLHVGAVTMTAVEAQERLAEKFTDWLPVDWSSEAQPDSLTVEQARQLAQWREVYARRIQAEAVDREATRQRSGAIVRGRGRPKKLPQLPVVPKRGRGRPKKANHG